MKQTEKGPEIISHEPQEFDVRVKKVEELRRMGIEPWPSSQEITNTCKQVHDEFIQDEQERQYTVAGRIMTIRIHGKTAFADIQDTSGRLQLYFKLDSIGQEAFTLFERFIDTGDIIACKGFSFKTKMGEVTLHVKQFTLLSKCLQPLPEKFHGLTDIETKYRQRYIDLMTNPETRERFIKRSAIIKLMRCFLDEHGYLEVETPMLHPIAGGAAARPFITHHNTLNCDFYLRIAPELYLKRLVVGGFDRVYEINRNFRNEGVSTRHNPEFTMLEFYTAYKDYIFSMDFVQEMLQKLALEVTGSLHLPYDGNTIDFEKPFERISVKDSVIKYGNLTEHDLSDSTIDATLEKQGIKINQASSTGEKIYLLFEKLVEHQLIQPTFIKDFPIEISPLAKSDPEHKEVAPRFELFIAGIEFANSYNELNDPFEQARRFQDQLKAYTSGNEEAHQYDADFVKALEYGLPPTVGVGIGIDRVVMLLTGTPTIKEVILFPTLKKKLD